MLLLPQGSSCFCYQVLSFSISLLSKFNMGQFQLLLLSFEQNIPGCTVLLLSLSRLTSFQLKALRNVGIGCYVGREKQQCKKYCSFFWRSLQSCGTMELRRNCIFTYFCTQDSDFGLEELTLRKCTGLAPGEKRFFVLVPFWKSTTWFKLCLAGSNFIYIWFVWVFF